MICLVTNIDFSGTKGVVFFCVIAAFLLINLAAVPMTIAGRKGYSKSAFYFFGLFGLLPALIVACVLRPKIKANDDQDIKDRDL